MRRSGKTSVERSNGMLGLRSTVERYFKYELPKIKKSKSSRLSIVLSLFQKKLNLSSVRANTPAAIYSLGVSKGNKAIEGTKTIFAKHVTSSTYPWLRHPMAHPFFSSSTPQSVVSSASSGYSASGSYSASASAFSSMSSDSEYGALPETSRSWKAETALDWRHRRSGDLQNVDKAIQLYENRESYVQLLQQELPPETAGNGPMWTNPKIMHDLEAICLVFLINKRPHPVTNLKKKFERWYNANRKERTLRNKNGVVETMRYRISMLSIPDRWDHLAANLPNF